MSSPLGTRVSVDQICRDCELEILGILLTLDLRVMKMSEFDVILRMDWLTAHRVVIDYDRRSATAYTLDDIRVMFQGDKHDALPQAVYASRWHRQFMGWLTSLTFKDEVRQELSLPQVVYEYEDIPDELPGLPPHRDVDFTLHYHLGKANVVADVLGRKSWGVLASVASREW